MTDQGAGRTGGREWVLYLVVVLVAVLLHLPARLGPGGAGKQALPEDGPALLDNDALSVRRPGGRLAVIRAAVAEPVGSWGDVRSPVGRSRWRPVSNVAAAVQKNLAPGSVTAWVSAVSLALHVLVALLAVSIARRYTGSSRVAWMAGLLVAATPVALAPADWPARQSVVLAGALGLAGVRLALSQRPGARLGAGFALAAAVLSHEAAFGLVPAAWVLSVSHGRRIGGKGAPRSLVLPVLSLIGWVAVVVGWNRGSPVPDGADGGWVSSVLVSLLDGCVGLVHAAVSLVVPARVHLADGPWEAGVVGRLICVAVIVVGVRALWVRRSRPAGALGLAWTLALSPCLVAGMVGGAAFHDHYAYLGVALGATALACVVVPRVSAGPRWAAVAVGALLLGASVAGTVTRASAFRTRDGLTALLRSEAPDSPVTRARVVGGRMIASAATAQDRLAVLSATLPDVRALVLDLTDERARRLAGDRVAADAVARTLEGYAMWAVGSDLEPWRSEIEVAEDGAARGVVVRPGHPGSWVALASVRARRGDVLGAAEAARVALAAWSDDPDVARIAADLAMSLGDPHSAVGILDHAAVAAHDGGVALDREFDLAFARALAADGAFQDLWGGRPRFRFEAALERLDAIAAEHPEWPSATALRHEALVRYGDFLASRDNTVLARAAYGQAAAIQRHGEGAEHLRWLDRRLSAERDDAVIAIGRAKRGEGNIANALADMAVVLCRTGDFEAADEAFDSLSGPDGSMTPALRYLRARHRFAWNPDPKWLTEAEKELRIVLETGGERLREARVLLGRVLEDQGLFEDALKEYNRAAVEGLLFEWGLDALDNARRLDGVNESLAIR